MIGDDWLDTDGPETDVGAKDKDSQRRARRERIDMDAYREARRMFLLAGSLFGVMAFVIACLAYVLGMRRGSDQPPVTSPRLAVPRMEIATPEPPPLPDPAEMARREAAQRELDRILNEQKRYWSSQVIRLAEQRYPNPMNPLADYVRVADSAATDLENSWVFRLRVRPESGMEIRYPATVCYEVRKGILDPEPISEKRYAWLTMTTEEVAQWFIHHDGNDPPEPMEILDLQSPQLGTLTARLRGRNTAEAYQLDVTDFEDSSLVRVSDLR